MSKTYLKVKIKSLAEEAHIIRKEERKSLNRGRHILKYANTLHTIQYDENGNVQLLNNEDATTYQRTMSEYEGLRNHRILDVRNEARAAQLAYAFARGKPFSYAEANTDSSNWILYQSNKLLYPEYEALINRVTRLINKYHDPSIKPENIKTWVMEKVFEDKKAA